MMLHACQERELASRILAALACTEADDEDSGKKEQLDLPQLLGIVQMRGNLPAQKAAAEQVAQEVGGLLWAGLVHPVNTHNIALVSSSWCGKVSPPMAVFAKVGGHNRSRYLCCYW